MQFATVRSLRYIPGRATQEQLSYFVGYMLDNVGNDRNNPHSKLRGGVRNRIKEPRLLR